MAMDSSCFQSLKNQTAASFLSVLPLLHIAPLRDVETVLIRTEPDEVTSVRDSNY